MKDFIIQDKKFIIGESARENSQIFRNAKQDDLWFHLDGTSSATGILESGGNIKIAKQLFYLQHPKKTRYKILILKVKQVTMIGEGLFKTKT